MTWSEHIAYAAEKLSDSGVDDAKTNAEYLAMHACGLKSRSELRSKINNRIHYKHAVEFSQLVFRRICREPLQYILGEWEFYGLQIKLSPSVLIPRPETEILVEQAHAEALYMPKQITILDVGTGSGAIALALAANIPLATVRGLDSSPKAIAVAKENRRRLKIQNVFFHKGDFLSEKWIGKQKNKFDLIVSNPPYVSLDDFGTLQPEIRLYEPRQAITDGSTGLTFYKRLAELAPRLLSKRGFLIVELGYGAHELVANIMTSAGLEVRRIVPDLAGIPRVLVACLLSRDE
jgi:release factor glutamine methyltransferase